MKTADEMFRKLGYTKFTSETGDILYMKNLFMITFIRATIRYSQNKLLGKRRK